MNKKKTAKLISINLLLFIFFTVFIELLLGKWRKYLKSDFNYVQIPALIKDSVLKYDGRWIYSSSEPFPIVYSRDKSGYRSKDPYSQKKIILTIGGSTTDNRFVTDGETWQDYLDKKITDFDFINGGVDGQSSYGHTKSIINWHSKALNNKNVSVIIFYIGINDIRILNNKLTDYDYAQSPQIYLKNLLKDNSFFVRRTLKLRNKLYYYFNYIKDIEDLINSHSARKLEFLDKGIRYELKEEIKLSSYPTYKVIFSNLIKASKHYFPESRIIIIQQQIPGCRFINKKITYDRHPYQSNYCLDLAKLFNMQDLVVSDFAFNDRVMIFPMYLKEILKDNDVYDYVHTNSKGSKRIGEYIESIISK